MKRKIIAIFGVIAMSALALGLSATPASATGTLEASETIQAPSSDDIGIMVDCTANRFCLYPNSGYGGTRYRYNPTTSCTNVSSGINNNANSMRNYQNRFIRLYDFPGCVGTNHYTAQPLSFDSTFGNNGFTNKASSLKRI